MMRSSSRRDVLAALLGLGQHRDRFDLLQENADRFFELQQLGHGRYRRVTEPAPHSASTAFSSCSDGLTRICGMTSALTRSCTAAALRRPARSPPADRPDWPAAGPTSASSFCRVQSPFRWMRTRLGEPLAQRFERKDLVGLHPRRFFVALELAAHRDERAVLDQRRKPGVGLGEGDDFDRPLRVFEHEDAHPVALLGLERPEAGDDAADVNVLEQRDGRARRRSDCGSSARTRSPTVRAPNARSASA